MNLSIKYTFKIGFQRKYKIRDHPAQIEYEILAPQVLFRFNSLCGIHSTPLHTSICPVFTKKPISVLSHIKPF